MKPSAPLSYGVQVEGAVRQAMEEASRRNEGSSHNGSASGSMRGGLNFKQFVRMLRSGSLDSLDLYDDRLGSSFGSAGSLNALSESCDRSMHGRSHYSSSLQTVVESDKW